MAGSPGYAQPFFPDDAMEYVAATPDRRFGIRIPRRLLHQVQGWCANTPGRETGGLLVGRYTDDHTFAVVTEVLPAPIDSRAGPTWFIRGVEGLTSELGRRWKLGQGYYLGEWHYHPGGKATPSSRDIDQMRSISASEQYACPEPVLLIVGGVLGAFEARPYVFPANSEFTELFVDGSVDSSA